MHHCRQLQRFKFKDAWKLDNQGVRIDNNFALDRNTGMITMKKGMDFGNKDVRTFSIDFLVEDPTHGQVGSKAVHATVNITVQKISRYKSHLNHTLAEL